MRWNATTSGMLLGLAVGLGGCAGTAKSSEQSDAWWLVPDLGDGDDSDGGFDDDEDDEDAEYEAGAYFWGEASISDGELEWGAMGFHAASDDGELLCEAEYLLAAAEPVDGCEACTFAYTLTYGELDFVEGESSACDDYAWDALEGQSVTMGASGETLYRLLEGSWVAVGASEQEGSEWFFEGAVE